MMDFICGIILLVGFDIAACGQSIEALNQRVVDGDTIKVTSRGGQSIEVFNQRVVDGDTIVVTELNGDRTLRVRLLGIDAPEVKGKCEIEIRGARAATNFLRAMLPVQQKITLTSPESSWRYDRYGRLLAKVEIGGQDMGDLMVAKGLVRNWAPPTPKINWCGGG